MRYEIINPSDDYFLEADSLEVAALACLCIGRGQYGLKGENGEDCPIFLLGGAAEWWQEKFGHSLESSLEEHLKGPKSQELVRCLDSVMIRGCATKEEHDKHRSSLNDIGRYAWAFAADVKAKYESGARARR